MNPFEASRVRALCLRAELERKGFNVLARSSDLWKRVCDDHDLLVERVSPNHPGLKGADATINVTERWLIVRDDVSEETCSFLVAHEIGHFLLHANSSATFEASASSLTADEETHGVKEIETYGARERQELQANVFAREFLLPKSLARTLFLQRNLGLSAIASRFTLPDELVRLQLYDGLLLPDLPSRPSAPALPPAPTAAQRPAVDSDARVTLVQAGPGTGKTTALLLRLRRLIEAGADPQAIVVITFSNKAARELVERAKAAGLPEADRVWIGTFHAFGLELLRKFGELVQLKARFAVLDKLATLALLEAEVPSLELKAFDVLSNPSPWLEQVVDTIRRAKDEVVDAEGFASAVVASPAPRVEDQAARRDVASIYQRYELLLSQRRAADLPDLLCLAIRVLQSQDPAVVAYLRNVHHVMVDEYQDVNRASALLVKELSRYARTLWIVADPNQAIYGFMGASSANLRSLPADFPGAVSIPLAENHRSSQEIVDTFCAIAVRNPSRSASMKLQAKKGKSGHGPVVITASDAAQEVSALARRIRDLEQSGVPLSEQAVIGYRNSYLASLAKGLESADMPILFLGNIFDRPEIKDLLCLLQLAVDPYGTYLLRKWQQPLLRLSARSVDSILAAVRDSGTPWTQVPVDGLDPSDSAALATLRRLCQRIDGAQSPWDALARLLLEDGALLRAGAADVSQTALNARMAIWQFVHFCRTPDGTGRWSTVRNLPQRIRDRIRLGEDRSLRMVPPEAEGLNAVRILTAHGSKGLEFDAVHFVDVTARIFEPSRDDANPWLPDGIIAGHATAHETLQSERHNLLYVVVSRPRSYLTVHTRDPATLPKALAGLLTPVSYPVASPKASAPRPDAAPPQQEVVALEEYLRFIQCPHQYELAKRAGKSPREPLKLYRALDLAVRKSMEALMADPALVSGTAWQDVLEREIQHFGLHEESSAAAIRLRARAILENGRRFLLEGGQRQRTLLISLGPLAVEFKSDQAFESKGRLKLRLLRLKPSILNSIKQPLAVLLDAHKRGGGATLDIEVATLADGLVTPIGTIRANTRERYLRLASQLCDARFPPSPLEIRNCMFCGYLFPCTGPDPR